MESGDQTPPRTDLDGDSRDEGDAQAATRILPATGFSPPSLSSRDSRGPNSAFDRRRDRPVAHAHASAAQGAPGRGQRDGVAENSEGDLREEKHLRTRVKQMFAKKRGPAAASSLFPPPAPGGITHAPAHLESSPGHASDMVILKSGSTVEECPSGDTTVLQRNMPSRRNEAKDVFGVPGGIRTHVIRSHSPAFHR